MTYLEIALKNASLGYPIFPAQRDSKRPMAGFSDWESNATTDHDTIKEWWSIEDWLPAVPPGRVDMGVIDVDQHEGKENGFDSLERYKIDLPGTFNRPSVSGNGRHYWYRGEYSSVNGILPGVDRKSYGGYIVAVYELPSQNEILLPIPERLSGGRTESAERVRKSRTQLNVWLADVGGGEPDEVMWDLLEGYLPSGNGHMSKYIARVVSNAAKGHPGAAEVLNGIRDKWMSVSHASGDPEEEFMVNVRTAIEKFGEPKPEKTMQEKIASLLNPSPKLGTAEENINFLRLYCSNQRPGWESTHFLPVSHVLGRVSATLERVSSEQEWREELNRFRIELKELLRGP